MIAAIRIACVFLLLMTVLTGLLYPLFITAVSQTLFNHRANGSLILDKKGSVIGSELLGQNFKKNSYFWSRPSAAVPPYNAAASAASNLSPANPVLRKRVEDRAAVLRKLHPGKIIPVDLLTTSASGLDPHISLAAAEYQAMRVARARGMKEEDIRALIDAHAQSNIFSGERFINVLSLNLALDSL